MSDPANILDQFRSHSYHHILYACDNSRAANRIATNDFEISDFTRIGISSAGPNVVLGDEIPADQDTPNQFTRDGVTREKLGSYVTLINGFTDSRYVIQKVEWETLTAATVNDTDYGNSLAVEGTMTIQEPRGFEFMNLIDSVQDAFQTDATGIIFLLKTVWVGNTDAGNLTSNPDSATNLISDVRPLQFLIVDITATFDAAGGTYSVKFVGLNDGASRLPQISRGAEENNFTPTSRVLSEVLGEFEQKLNAAALESHRAVVEELGKRTDFADPAQAAELRRVEYKIDLKAPYTDPEYVLDNFDQTQTEQGEPDSIGPIHTGVKFTVEQVLQRIMSLSKKVQNDLREGVDSVKYRYKISSALEMTRGDFTGENVTTNQEVLQITYYIQQFPEMTNKSVTDLLTGQAGDSNTTEQQIRDNLITFDYIFTGKNIDIKNFDMKLNQGLLFLQTLRTTDNKMTQIELLTRGTVENKQIVVGSLNGTDQDTESDEDSPPTTRVQNIVRKRTPIFPGTTYKDIVTKNIGQPEDMSAFNSAMQQHAALEQLQTTLVIRGNPYLLSQTNRPPREDLDRQDTSDNEDRSVRVMKNWNRIPAIAKVNIRMPLNSDTLSSENSPELTKFWYDGYYYIFSIKHMFDGGEFTQKLDMLSMPQNTIFDPLTESPVNDTGDTNNNVGAVDEASATTVPSTRETQYARHQHRSEEAAKARQAAEQVERAKQAPPTSNGKQRRNGGDNG